VSTPRVLVYSSLFPSAISPTSGTFIRERLFRFGKLAPIVVIAPQVWSPFDGILRLVRKSFRPLAPEYEVMDGVEVYRPKVLSIPKILKRWDGFLMARGSKSCMAKVVAKFKPTLIDAHFLYPDGYAASILAKDFKLPLTITLRGSKDEWLIGTDREPYLKKALHSATSLISVSAALKRDVAQRLGVESSKVTVIGNGVDLEKFTPVDRQVARRKLNLADEAKVLISVGGLIPRKGFHRIIPLLPALREKHPSLVYLIVGGGTTQADMRSELEQLAAKHGVSDCVRFCGPQQPADLQWFYGAADIFCLATEHEGWANVFLEAMACGLPVITTDVGGNLEVVTEERFGTVVPYFNPKAFQNALDESLLRTWDRASIIAYARNNTWDKRMQVLMQTLSQAASIGFKG
jgi:teichuronic acid biosynthesis glycosyltransferase TuaC